MLEGGEEKSEGGEEGKKKRGVGAMVKVFHFIMKQSYVCALIAMMVSKVAHGWRKVAANRGSFKVQFASCIFICDFKTEGKQTVAKITL